MIADCLEEGTVLAFLGGALQPDALATVEQHIAACGACADLVTWAAADQANSTTRLPGHEGRPFVGHLHPGARVGRYQILGAVGRGGMGEVYAAYHPDLDRRIALKVVHGLAGDTSERRARLLREARAIARLSHPNVVTVHDAGSFGDRVFIAMEFVDGLTVDDWLRAAPRTWQRIVDAFMAAGRGLAAAHAAGVVHRDFKPQNVMIGKDGAVRVMDFGLARLAHDDAPDGDVPGESGPPRILPIDTQTKTGAFIGTPAYMSPEQFRREKSDARSDQYSFCVALHEALYGARPATAASDTGRAAAKPSKPHHRPAGVPGWIRAIVRRGASPVRDKRYPSMDALLAALDRGRMRVRRHVLVAAASVGVLLVGVSGWRLARGNRFLCTAPNDRIAAVWSPTDAGGARRQAIHRAFTTSGAASAETSWRRVSAILDEYAGAWAAMYLQTCEATHLRGEQSADVLDLRMSCLNDNLDQARALTDALASADASMVSRAITAAKDLTPVSRCADISLLKSAVPLPKDQHTLDQVLRLRRAIAEVEVLHDLGKLTEALARTAALRKPVEATGYKPLLAQLLATQGLLQSHLHIREGEKNLEDAVFVAESARDDATEAKAAGCLVYLVGVDLGRVDDAERWARLAGAILERLPPDHARIRGWLAHNLGAVYVINGKPDKALPFAEQALALKKAALGDEHPDVAISLGALAWISIELGRAKDALEYAEAAIHVFSNSMPSNELLADSLLNKGQALLALRRYAEAQNSFEHALRILDGESDQNKPELAEGLTGVGSIMVARGNPAGAVDLLERALEIYDRYPGMRRMAADTQAALARALWTAGDRQRARHLAETARQIYESHARTDKAHECAGWLAAHKQSS